MYFVNKAIWFFLNPVMVLPVVALAALFFGRNRRWCRVVAAISLFTLLFASTFSSAFVLGYFLEKPYLGYEDAARSSAAEAIVLLGGGIRAVPSMKYPDITDGGDRLLHAARLYKAGKAPRIIVCGKLDLEATVPVLLELGVPRDAIEVDNESRNTYENSRNAVRIAGKGARVLLVTSAWHMTRAIGNFRAAGLEVEPAPADFKVLSYPRDENILFYITPSAESLLLTQTFFKEWLGRFARR